MVLEAWEVRGWLEGAGSEEVEREVARGWLLLAEWLKGIGRMTMVKLMGTFAEVGNMSAKLAVWSNKSACSKASSVEQ
jgi:hypothetical protein